MKHKGLGFVLSLALVALGLSTANGAVITTLYNTGVDNSGNVLANNVPDGHYQVTASPLGAFIPRTATAAGEGFPIPPWLGDSTVSRWIGPNTTDLVAGDGLFTYRTTFDLTGFIPGTASISGRWSTDDPGVNIFINGVATGQTSIDFTQWSAFTITSGFVNGINTIDFVVNNQNNPAVSDTGPTGLRVEMTGTGNLLVPEPASMSIWAAGMGLVVGGGALRRRFFAKKA